MLLQRIAHMLESGDPSVMEGSAAPDAVVWHNDDGVEVPASTAFDGARSLKTLVDHLRVEIVREFPIQGGVVAQLELTGTVKQSGAPLRARNCMFLYERSGQVQRVEEYLDPTFGSQLGV
jgi:ketosteroid isomerase-like protein